MWGVKCDVRVQLCPLSGVAATEAARWSVQCEPSRSHGPAVLRAHTATTDRLTLPLAIQTTTCFGGNMFRNTINFYDPNVLFIEHINHICTNQNVLVIWDLQSNNGQATDFFIFELAWISFYVCNQSVVFIERISQASTNQNVLAM